MVAAIAPGLMSTAILTVNNLRDIDSDRKAGKRTLAVRFGRQFARMEYLASILGACLVPVLLTILRPGHPYALVAAAVFLLAIPSITRVFREEPGPVFNLILANTGRLLFIYSILFSIGWVL
jgi:1,4-dihydroxy-2-naphthoate octaprenyltransferase